MSDPVKTVLTAIIVVVLLFVLGAVSKTLIESPASDEQTDKAIESVRDNTFRSVGIGIGIGVVVVLTIGGAVIYIKLNS